MIRVISMTVQGLDVLRPHACNLEELAGILDAELCVLWEVGSHRRLYGQVWDLKFVVPDT